MKYLLLLVALSLPALADDLPVIVSPPACLIFADAALVTRAAAMSGINKEQTRKLVENIYGWTTTPASIVLETVLIDHAFASKLDAAAYGEGVTKACLENQGKLDKFFGAGVML